MPAGLLAADQEQLVRGGSDRRLQNAALLQVLPLLAGSKLMSSDDIAELTEAYLVLRKAENALQMMRDEQSHALPQDPLDRARPCQEANRARAEAVSEEARAQGPGSHHRAAQRAEKYR